MEFGVAVASGKGGVGKSFTSYSVEFGALLVPGSYESRAEFHVLQCGVRRLSEFGSASKFGQSFTSYSVEFGGAVLQVGAKELASFHVLQCGVRRKAFVGL